MRSPKKLISEIVFKPGFETLSRILIWQLFYVPKKNHSASSIHQELGKIYTFFSRGSKTFVKQTLKTKSKNQSFLVLPESHF